jgi:hypothetical protein
MQNIFNKNKAENVPNLKKHLSIQVWEASRTPNRLDQIESLNSILSLKQLHKNRERILKAVTEKK